MSYLVPFKGRPKNAAHIWTGKDTCCRMMSTGGLGPRRSYRVTETPEGRRICVMCVNVKTNQETWELNERFLTVLAKEK